jgi:Protein of unknown function (DUF732)
MAAAFVVLGLATAAGIASFQGPTQRPSITAPSSNQVITAGPTVVNPPGNTTTQIGPRATAFLEALNRENIPIADTHTLLLVADSICARKSDTTVQAQAERLMTAFPGRWNSQQAVTIVDYAIKLVCDETAPPGMAVSSNASG